MGILASLTVGGCTDRARLGRQLYEKHGCAVCHGSSGRGDGPAAKTLVPPPRDFAVAARYRQGSSREAIADSIRSGMDTAGSSMPAFPNLSEDEALLLAEWISSLQEKD